jgi:hypothetical protein
MRVATAASAKAGGSGIERDVDITPFGDCLEHVFDGLRLHCRLGGVRAALRACFRRDHHGTAFSDEQFAAIEKREFYPASGVRDDRFAFFQHISFAQRSQVAVRILGESGARDRGDGGDWLTGGHLALPVWSDRTD